MYKTSMNLRLMMWWLFDYVVNISTITANMHLASLLSVMYCFYRLLDICQPNIFVLLLHKIQVFVHAKSSP